MIRKTVASIVIFSMVALVGCSKPSVQGTAQPVDPKGKADLLLSQLSGYIGEGMISDAEAAMGKLEELKPNLPAEYADKIEKAGKAVAAAKAKAPK